ncbi:tRNA glutamyl-Q(34) synthetase GluQRS [Pararhodobacter oceanensis]|uniref:tRNA glutamyl-Q(34) synthetase GluQRS n=1 Tax=Pararhodobacter oceanensis TaxID=2172121 RepID=UPI003A93B5BC
MIFRTRFAPSPTGPLHLGHAYSALLAHDHARRMPAGQFLLRIDDIDQSRARREWEQQIYQDLAWLGITWDAPPRRESDHLAEYQAALQCLADRGLIYPCSCSRRDIREAASAPQERTPRQGPDGLIYPGICRGRAMSDMRESDAIRLDMRKAIDSLPALPRFREIGDLHKGIHALTTTTLCHGIGDAVLARPHMGASYHLSVVVDDAAQRITHAIRGADLFAATALHRLLAALLDLASPVYLHHDLIRDAAGKRLAKRDDARAIRLYRSEGATPEDIRRMVGLPPA